MRALIGLSLIALAACEPEMPAISDSVKVIEKAENKAVAQAFMRQHCLRSPACDPTTDYGRGVGQASGVAGSAAWFVETKDVVKESSADLVIE